jgi:predicted small lipoprotein YifL
MRSRVLAIALLAATVAGCGPTPPQAPKPEAKRLDKSLGDISSACGEAYQVTAFPGNHHSDLVTLEVTATSAAREFASVYARNPDWIYQSARLRKIASDAVSTLQACGLGGAAHTLRQTTSAP